MKKNQQNKKSRSAIAAVLAIAILVSGTFAWQAFDQEALNETQGDLANPGARLHDDFDGENKDVYVENYFTIQEGGSPVYARVRLDEYMEYGEGAGVLEEDIHRDTEMVILEGDLPKYNQSLQPRTPDIYDETTWYTHQYQDDITGDDGLGEINEEENIRTYRSLNFGGTTVYMPTFNKNSTSEEAQLNGTLEGKSGDRFTNNPYTDYYQYTDQETQVDDAYYYWDGESEVPVYLNGDESEELTVEKDEALNQYRVIDQTHTAQETVGYDAVPQSVSDLAGADGIITMEQWLTLSYEDKVGDYWVYDEDGWAYWANGILPETATNLLLTGIETLENPQGTQVYYAINVVSEFASPGDFGDPNGATPEDQGMYADITEAGSALLDRVAAQGNTVINLTDELGNIVANEITDQKEGEVREMGVLVNVPGATIGESGMTFMVCDEAGNELTQFAGTIVAQAPQSLEGQTGAWTQIAFTPAVGMSGKYIIKGTATIDPTQTISYLVNVYNEASVTVTVTEKDGKTEVQKGGTASFSAEVTGLENDTVTWSITSTKEMADGTGIEENTGILSVDAAEKSAAVFTVTATASGVEGTAIISTPDIIEDYIGIDDTIDIDDESWYLLAQEIVMTYDENGNEIGEQLATLLGVQLH